MFFFQVEEIFAALFILFEALYPYLKHSFLESVECKSYQCRMQNPDAHGV